MENENSGNSFIPPKKHSSRRSKKFDIGLFNLDLNPLRFTLALIKEHGAEHTYSIANSLAKNEPMGPYGKTEGFWTTVAGTAKKRIKR